MEKIRLSSKSAGKYVRKALIFIGYPENIRVVTKVTEDGNLLYEALYQVFYKGKFQNVLMPLSSKNYYDMLNYGLELDGIKPLFLNKRVKGNSVTYTVGYNAVVFDDISKRKKYK